MTKIPLIDIGILAEALRVLKYTVLSVLDSIKVLELCLTFIYMHLYMKKDDIQKNKWHDIDNWRLKYVPIFINI